MVLITRNPCKICIVQATCRFNCDQFKQFSESRLKTKFFLELTILFSYVAITTIPALLYMEDKPNIQILLSILIFPTIISTGVGLMIKVENLLDKHYLPYTHRRDYL